MCRNTGIDPTAQHVACCLWTSRRATFPAACYAGPTAGQRRQDRAKTSDRSRSFARATNPLGRTHAIAPARRERVQGARVAEAWIKSRITVGYVGLNHQRGLQVGRLFKSKPFLLRSDVSDPALRSGKFRPVEIERFAYSTNHAWVEFVAWPHQSHFGCSPLEMDRKRAVTFSAFFVLRIETAPLFR
jgi:hypothetical protein